VSRRKTGRPGEISIPPGAGFDKGHSCTCWPTPDDPRPCTPQTCDWRCRACSIHGRPFYSHGDLQYLEHGTGPLAAELDRLWRAKGTMKGGTTRQGARHYGDSWRALPRGAAGLALRRPHSLPVTDLFYPGLQDPPQGQDPPPGARRPQRRQGAVDGSLLCRLADLFLAWLMPPRGSGAASPSGALRAI
jgi:hypothetical protein